MRCGSCVTGGGSTRSVGYTCTTIHRPTTEPPAGCSTGTAFPSLATSPSSSADPVSGGSSSSGPSGNAGRKGHAAVTLALVLYAGGCALSPAFGGFYALSLWAPIGIGLLV